jgi:uncharacterized protein (DUF362 family)
MNPMSQTRREFLATSIKVAVGTAAGTLTKNSLGTSSEKGKPLVSIVKIRSGKTGRAVSQALDLLGGVQTIAKGKDSIMLKPNLLGPDPRATTKPEIIKELVRLMKAAGKDVCIGEGSAASPGFNIRGEETFRTKNRQILDSMQKAVFEQLGYADLAKSLKIPLVNLHSGEMADVEVPNGFVFDKITLHRSLTDIDLLCSVPMMKTHVFTKVTLGMKNLMGVYPGTVYQSVRGMVHDLAAEVEPSGTAVAIVDVVRANKVGLVIIDGSTAMEGDGPTDGDLVRMDVIIAGTNPLATDMVAAAAMGFEPDEIPTFTWANKAGMVPPRLDEIEIRGEKLERVRHRFLKPKIYTWESVRKVWAAKQL